MPYQVDLTLLEEIVAGLDTAQSRLDEQLGTLDGIVAGLRHIWTGEAADAQQRAYATWSRDARAMHQALRVIHGAASTAHSNYSAAVAANVEMWGQLA